MNFKEVIYRVRHRVGDVNKSKGIPARIYIDVVNKAIRDIIEDNGGLQAEYTCDSVDGQGDYSLPNGLKGIEWCKYDGDNVEYMDAQAFYNEIQFDSEDVAEGTPTYYTTRYINGYGKILSFYPVPNSDNKTIRIGAKIEYPTLTEDNYSDIINLPDYMIDAIIDHATWLMFKEIQDWRGAKEWKREATEQKVLSRPTIKSRRRGLKIE